MKQFLLILFLSFGVSAEYNAMSRRDRTEFEQAYRAIKSAFVEQNYKAIVKFTPELVTRYESVMLDPSCKKLRPFFLEMNQILKDARNIRAADSLETIVSSTYKSGTTQELLQTYDAILPILASVDSARYQFHLAYYNAFAVSLASGRTMATYSFLSTLKFVDKSILANARNTVKSKFDTRIAQLSAGMDPDSIQTFQLLYPGVERDDIAALLDRARLARRQSLIRQPTIQGYVDYKKHFGDDKVLREVLVSQSFKAALGTIPDPAPVKEYVAHFPEEGPLIWNQFEDSLFARWSSRRNSMNTQLYMQLYPQGKYAAIIQEHLSSIQTLSTYTPGYFDGRVGP